MHIQIHMHIHIQIHIHIRIYRWYPHGCLNVKQKQQSKASFTQECPGRWYTMDTYGYRGHPWPQRQSPGNLLSDLFEHVGLHPGQELTSAASQLRSSTRCMKTGQPSPGISTARCIRSLARGDHGGSLTHLVLWSLIIPFVMDSLLLALV